MYNRQYYIRRKSCMGSVDIAYLNHFKEHPFDTVERLVKGGISREKAYETVDGRIKTLSSQLIEIKRQEEEKEQERLFSECPFLSPAGLHRSST